MEGIKEWYERGGGGGNLLEKFKEVCGTLGIGRDLRYSTVRKVLMR